MRRLKKVFISLKNLVNLCCNGSFQVCHSGVHYFQCYEVEILFTGLCGGTRLTNARAI